MAETTTPQAEVFHAFRLSPSRMKLLAVVFAPLPFVIVGLLELLHTAPREVVGWVVLAGTLPLMGLMLFVSLRVARWQTRVQLRCDLVARQVICESPTPNKGLGFVLPAASIMEVLRRPDGAGELLIFFTPGNLQQLKVEVWFPAAQQREAIALEHAVRALCGLAPARPTLDAG